MQQGRFRGFHGTRKDSCSEEEKLLLLEIFEHNTKNAIIEKFKERGFDRSPQSIFRFAKQLGLKRDPEIIKLEILEAGKKGVAANEDLWKPEEDQIIIEFYACSLQEELERKLPGRTFRAIRERALHLGLHRNKEMIDKDRALHLKEHLGVTSTWQLESVKEKSRETREKNGYHKFSQQQIYIANLLNKRINFPVGDCIVDILLEDNMICEYDGGGHDLQVKLNCLSRESFNIHERKREFFLKSKGYSIIRIISEDDLLPKDEIILKMINEGKDYLNSGHSWIEFNIDKKQVRCSQYQTDYNFGILRKIK